MVSEIKHKWHQSNSGIIVMFFLFFPLALYNMWKYGTWKTISKWKVTGGLFLVLFLFSLAYNLSPKAQQNRAEIERINLLYKPTENPTSTPAPIYSYEIVEKKDKGNIESYKVLIKSGDDGKTLALEVKKECKKPCNIDIYDDKQALELQQQYDDMIATLGTAPKELQAWKKNNYVFVAEHLVGYMLNTGEYQEYPYKDWYYKEQKGI